MALAIYIGIGLIFAIGFLLAFSISLHTKEKEREKFQKLMKSAEVSSGVSGGSLIILVFIVITLFYPFVIIGMAIEEK